MSKWVLQSVSIKNFRSIKSLTLDFPSEGLVLLSAPSGFGKSNVLQAVAYALDFCDLPSKKLQAWNEVEPYEVKLKIQQDEKTLLISRTARGLVVQCEGQVHKGKAAEELLQIELKVDHATRRVLSYRDQKNPKSFLDLKDAEIKDFLSPLLGLDKFDDLIQEQKEYVSKCSLTLTENKNILQAQVDSASRIAATFVNGLEESYDINQLHDEKRKVNQKIQDLKPPEIQLEDLKKDIDKLRAAQKALEAKRHEAFKVQSAAQNEWTEKQNEIKLLEHKALVKKKEYDKLKEQVAREEEQRDSCSQCGSQWTTISHTQHVEKLKAKLEQSHGELAQAVYALKDAISRLPSKPGQIECEPPTEQEEKISKAIEKLVERQATSQQAAALANAEYRSKVNEFLAEIQRIDGKIQLTTEIDNKKRMLEEVKKQIAALEGEMASCVDELKVFQNKNEAIKVLMSFRAKVFDDILQEIGQEATAICGELSNVDHVEISWSSERTTQKDRVIERIYPIVSIDNNTERDLSDLSGGQTTNVRLAVDLAVIKVLERRAGSSLGWLILDEVLDGNSPETRQAAHDVLKNAARDKLIIVVDHAAEFKELFSSTIQLNELM